MTPNSTKVDRTMILERLIHAAPEQVWRAWTDPTVLPNWFGPAGYSCHTKEIDLRTGGIWRFDMIGPDGTVWPNRHHALTYQPHHRITFLMDDDTDNGPLMEVTVTLTPQDGGTLLIQKVVLPTAQAYAEAKAFGAIEAGQSTLAKLAAMVEGK
jgi:uncharacterized protein YndB with AHSA1/START domain